MDGVVLAIIAAVGTLVGGGGMWAYASARRTSSGNVSTSEAKEVFDAMEKRNVRVDADMKEVRVLLKQLDGDYAVERRARIDCESRIALLESQDAGAAIVEAAKKEAAAIRFDAAKAAEVLNAAAAKAALTVTDDAATARQVIADAKDS